MLFSIQPNAVQPLNLLNLQFELTLMQFVLYYYQAVTWGKSIQMLIINYMQKQ